MMLTSLAEEMRARAAFEMQSKFVPLPPPRLAEHGDEDGGKRERERERASAAHKMADSSDSRGRTET